MNPKVSFIMGVYNGEKTIRRCINSIINQTYTNWELIVCDDCSTDNTYEILREFSKRDSRIKPQKNNENLKLAATLNLCLKNAEGKYIARVDADDICNEDRLAKQVEFIEQNKEYDVVGTSVIVFDESRIHGVRKAKEFPNKYDLRLSVPFMHPTILMKKSTYDALGGYSVSKRTHRGQDVDLWFRFFEKGFKGYNLQEPLYQYHESLNDYHKRSISKAIGISKTYLYGYKLLKFPIYFYPLLLKPVIASLIPNKIMNKYHKHTTA